MICMVWQLVRCSTTDVHCLALLPPAVRLCSVSDDASMCMAFPVVVASRMESPSRHRATHFSWSSPCRQHRLSSLSWDKFLSAQQVRYTGQLKLEKPLHLEQHGMTRTRSLIAISPLERMVSKSESGVRLMRPFSVSMTRKPSSVNCETGSIAAMLSVLLIGSTCAAGMEEVTDEHSSFTSEH